MQSPSQDFLSSKAAPERNLSDSNVKLSGPRAPSRFSRLSFAVCRRRYKEQCQFSELRRETTDHSAARVSISTASQKGRGGTSLQLRFLFPRGAAGAAYGPKS